MRDSFLDKCDGLVITSAEPYEREAIAHVTEWFAETSREVYTVGHLLPVGPNATSGENKQSERADEIIHFLDKTLEAEGPGSLIYVRISHSLMARICSRQFHRSLSVHSFGLWNQRKSGHFWISS